MPVCVAVDRLRPCTQVELLAYHHTQTKSSSPLAADAQTQQGDNLAPLNPTTVDPARSADGGEDERDDEMSEPTQNKEHTKAKRVSDGRNSKRVTGTVTFS